MAATQALSVFVCDDHNDVLPFVFQSVSTQRLPNTGITVVHIDSHADLLLPHTMPAEVVWTPSELFKSLSIGDFWLPAVYVGYVNRFIWIKPVWGREFEQGVYRFVIGKHKTLGVLRASLPHSGFVDEQLYCPVEDLENTVEIIFEVVVLEPPMVPKLDLNSPWILDVDLDFFSTNNPFYCQVKADFGDSVYSALDAMYSLKRSIVADFGSISESAQNNRLVLHNNITSTLQSVVQATIETSSTTELVNNLSMVVRVCCQELQLSLDQEKIVAEFLKALTSIRHAMQNDCLKEEWDAEWVHLSGCMTELPHHVSSEKEIDALFLSVESILKQVPQPTIVTVARSCEDNFTPSDQVDLIEHRLMKLLRCLYGSISVSK